MSDASTRSLTNSYQKNKSYHVFASHKGIIRPNMISQYHSKLVPEIEH